MSHVFFPRRIEFVKKSSRQLHHAFPGLLASSAQEAVAQALGFTSWFDACSRMVKTSAPPSPPDEAVSAGERLARRYQQITGIVQVTGLPSAEVEEFVRRWNLTASAAGRLDQFETAYAKMERALREFEAGTYDAAAYRARHDDESWDEPPRRIAEGILLGHASNALCYYALSVPRLLQVPLYLRGNQSVFFERETALSAALPGVLSQAAEDACLSYLTQQQPWLHEWHFGHLPARCPLPSLQTLGRQAAAHPNAWHILSLRRTYIGHDFCASALRGAAFAEFIASKGRYRSRDVQWFRLRDNEGKWPTATGRAGQPLHFVLGDDEGEPAEPFFASPFKYGPMHVMEYDMDTNDGCPLWLEQEATPERADGESPRTSRPDELGRDPGAVPP